jgi:hypothetical protein
MADGEASRRRVTRTTYGMSGEAAATLGARDPRPGACRRTGPQAALPRAGWLVAPPRRQAVGRRAG